MGARRPGAHRQLSCRWGIGNRRQRGRHRRVMHLDAATGPPLQETTADPGLQSSGLECSTTTCRTRVPR